ncbi:HDOD domain-containing protein [Pelagicoccus mobilis]|uniref:HDOD domain-containing protein n=1 Tax=Pelagicoccus mobilis TaxID=415221 RepID=A0A934S3T8_9BACT|nr:HDOD domain-containing protein [Pelagicoccus mobilis]MBK1880186.1 HDOD domain-containing protein [Pelagicoccus mobilis]
MPDQQENASPAKKVANAIVRGIKEGKLELPVMPSVASKIFSLTNNPDADMAELSKLIHGDQSIASHVLRIANSASYTSGEPIVSLQQAVTRLGMKLLGEIAIAVSLQGDIFQAAGFETQIKALLRHALASGAYGREIARKRRRNVEGQFLCGLMHSVGRPICLQLIAKVQSQERISLDPQEVQQIVNSLHSKIATKVAIDWKLPKQLQVTTVFYQKYENAPSFKDESAATYLSQLLGSWVMEPTKFNVIDLAKDPAIEYLNFYQDDFQDLLAKKDDVKAVVAAMEL